MQKRKEGEQGSVNQESELLKKYEGARVVYDISHKSFV